MRSPKAAHCQSHNKERGVRWMGAALQGRVGKGAHTLSLPNARKRAPLPTACIETQMAGKIARRCVFFANLCQAILPTLRAAGERLSPGVSCRGRPQGAPRVFVTLGQIK